MAALLWIHSVGPWLVHKLVRGATNGVQVNLIHCLKGSSDPVPQRGGGVSGGSFHLVELDLKLLHLTPELSLFVRSSCHHLSAQADHALEHPLDPLGQVLVLDGLPFQLLLQVVELLAQLLQTLLVSDLLDLLVSQGSLLLKDSLDGAVDLICSLEEPLHHLCHCVHMDAMTKMMERFFER